MRLYNALEKKVTEFVPLSDHVKMYYCGPTVYNYQHVGNMRAFFVMDTLYRTFKFLGYNPISVMNITDVGHLTSDADEGDDRMVIASKREHKRPEEIAEFYKKICLEDMQKLNITMPTYVVNATSVIPEIIDFVKTLIERGFAYETSTGIYYDISKCPNYGVLGGMNQEDKMMGARISVDNEKRNPADFVLWVKAPKEHIMKWESPWGLGYPGWHIECSTICRKYLGEDIDVHGGGVEHRPVHHENERAQNYGIAGKEVVRRWIHHEHLMVDGKKMSKSLGNGYILSDLIKMGFRPLDLRYFFLNAYYAKQQNLTENELKSSQTALSRVYLLASQHKNGNVKINREKIEEYLNKFKEAISDDLNTPRALAVMWEVLKEKDKSEDYYKLLLKFDEVLGLDLENSEKYLNDKKDVPEEIIKLAEERLASKKEKNYAKADELRNKIVDAGYIIKDTPSGYEIEKK